MSMPLAMFLNASSKFFTSFITYLHKRTEPVTLGARHSDNILATQDKMGVRCLQLEVDLHLPVDVVVRLPPGLRHGIQHLLALCASRNDSVNRRLFIDVYVF